MVNLAIEPFYATKCDAEPCLNFSFDGWIGVLSRDFFCFIKVSVV